MKNKNWIVILTFIGLVSIKYFYLFLANANNNYSIEKAYNHSDADHYLTIGKNLADFNVYSDNNSVIASENATWRPPFWPFVLSFFFRLTTNPFCIILLKSIFELVIFFTVLLKFKVKTNLKLVSLIPFFLILIEPYYLKYSITFLSESVTAVLILALAIVFLLLDDVKRHHILIPVLSGLIILCHPVSSFFVMTLFLIYLFLNYKSNFGISFLHGFLFLVIVIAWPSRNYLTFHKGFYITASQGATFSKGWNETVSTQFTNVDGDLADESLNLKFVDKSVLLNADKSILTLSKLYKMGTINYIKSISWEEKLNIVFVKLKSNFNPFPEKPKPGFLETLSIFFRILYLFVFLQMIYRFLSKRKIDYNSTKDRTYFVILAVLIGQIVMSVYIYTGLRFNSIYALTMLFCFINVNIEFLTKLYKKLAPLKANI